MIKKKMQKPLKNQAAELVMNGKFTQALEIYEKVKETDNDEPGVYNLMGDVYLKMRETDNAISQFKQALELYKKVQYYPNAIAVCKKILRTDKDQAEVYNELADLYDERGFIGEAVINYLEYARKMRAAGDIKKEIEIYKKVRELVPFRTDIREKLVDLYIAEGEKDAAIEELERIEQLLIQQDKQAKLSDIEERLKAVRTIKISIPKVVEEEELTKEKAKIISGYSMDDLIGEDYSTERRKGKKERDPSDSLFDKED